MVKVLAQPFECGIHCHSMNPAGKFGPTVESGNAFPATDEGVLQGVLGILRVVEDAHDHGIQSRSELFDELTKSSVLLRFEGSDKLFVDVDGFGQDAV